MKQRMLRKRPLSMQAELSNNLPGIWGTQTVDCVMHCGRMFSYQVHKFICVCEYKCAVNLLYKAPFVTETVHIKVNSAKQLDLFSSYNKPWFGQSLLTEVKFCSALKYLRCVFETLAVHSRAWQFFLFYFFSPSLIYPTGCSCSPVLLSSPFQVELRLMQLLSPQTLAKICLQARYQEPPSSLYARHCFSAAAFWTVNFWMPSETLGNSKKPHLQYISTWDVLLSMDFFFAHMLPVSQV